MRWRWRSTSTYQKRDPSGFLAWSLHSLWNYWTLPRPEYRSFGSLSSSPTRAELFDRPFAYLPPRRLGPISHSHFPARRLELRMHHPELRMRHPRLRTVHPQLREHHPELWMVHRHPRMDHPELWTVHPRPWMDHLQPRTRHPELRMVHPKLRMPAAPIFFWINRLPFALRQHLLRFILPPTVWSRLERRSSIVPVLPA